MAIGVGEVSGVAAPEALLRFLHEGGTCGDRFVHEGVDFLGAVEVVGDGHAAKELSDRGKPLSQVAPRSPLARSLRVLAQDLMKVHPPRQVQGN